MIYIIVINKGGYLNEKIISSFVVLLTFQAVALASPKNIDLREYQQATGTINVLAAPFENDNFYLATFNFDEQNKGDKVNFIKELVLWIRKIKKYYSLY